MRAFAAWTLPRWLAGAESGTLHSVPSPARAPSRWLRLRIAVTHYCLDNLLEVLVLAVSLSQWLLLWWVCPQLIDAVPALGHLGLPLALYVFNRLLTTRARRRRLAGTATGPTLRSYHAVCFTGIFCAGALLCTGALWGAAQLFLVGMRVEAWTAQVRLAVDPGVNTGFRWLADAAMAATGLIFMYGYTIGQRRLRITRLALPLLHGPAALDGLRLVQISDIHIGENLTARQLERFVAQVNDLDADLVCVTGDIVDGPAADLAAYLPILGGVRARYGVVAILGNHDHYAGADRVEAALRRWTTFTVLRDQYTSVTIRGHRLHVIGLDDPGRIPLRQAPRTPYLTTALGEIPPDEPTLLLCHRPDVFPQAAAAGVGLTLSGHTHGGQLGIPWIDGRVRNLAEMITAFDRGLFEHRGAYLYVNCGLGVAGQRIRLCTPREITVVELQQGPAESAAA